MNLALAPLALLLTSSALAEFTTNVVPDFRGDESTAFYGWTDWNNLQGGVAYPDVPGSTTVAPGVSPQLVSLSSGPISGVIVDEVCEPPGFTRFGIGYSTPVGREIFEVVLQLQGAGVSGATVNLAYVNVADTDYLGPVEVVQLAPDEVLFRFLSAAEGLPIGICCGELRAFQAQITLPSASGGCLDAVRMDVRYELDGTEDVACSANVNSLLVRAGLDAGGSSDVADNQFRLTASGIRPGEFGIFVASRSTAFVPCPGGCATNGGVLCLGGPIGRFRTVHQAGPDMSFAADIDLAAMPLFPAVAAQAGETWYFQAWFRDSSPVVPVAPSNFTNPVAITFR